MTLIINGESHDFQQDLTVPNLLKCLGLQGKPVVIEHNETALSPSDFAGCPLADGDRLEIITIAAGG